MSFTTIAIIGFVVALTAGWYIGTLVTQTAVSRFHLPTFGLSKLLPVMAALALAGGYSLGAWQASETFKPVPELVGSDLDASLCDSHTSCSPCRGCPIQ